MSCDIAQLYNMDNAPLDGSHIMVVFHDGSYKIREAWANSIEKDITWEYWTDDMELREIETAIGWFPIPIDFTKVKCM